MITHGMLATALLLASGSFGWLFARSVLGVRDIPALLGHTALLGFALFLFCTNALAYLFPIRASFTAGIALLVLTDIGLCAYFLRTRATLPQLEIPPRRSLWITALCMLPAFLVLMRDPGTDRSLFFRRQLLRQSLRSLSG